MIRITITTSPEWTPVAHGSSHGDPSYAHRIVNARITTGLNQLAQLFADHSEELVLPRPFKPELVRIIHLESSPADKNVADIDIDITLQSPFPDSVFERIEALVMELLDQLLDRHGPNNDPSVTLSIAFHRSYALHRTRNGETFHW